MEEPHTATYLQQSAQGKCQEQRNVPFEGAAEVGGDSESACAASSSNTQRSQPGKLKKQGQKRRAQQCWTSRVDVGGSGRCCAEGRGLRAHGSPVQAFVSMVAADASSTASAHDLLPLVTPGNAGLAGFTVCITSRHERVRRCLAHRRRD